MDPLLVITPDPRKSQTLVSALENEGYSCKLEAHLDNVINLIKSQKYCILIHDINDCYTINTEYLEAIRKEDLIVPIILITDQTNTDQLVKIANTGISLIEKMDFETTTIVNKIKACGFTATSFNPNQNLDQESSKQTFQMETTKAPQAKILPVFSLSAKENYFKLWEQFQSNDTFLLAGPKGSEVSLYAKEIFSWIEEKNEDLGNEHAILSLEADKFMDDSEHAALVKKLEASTEKEFIICVKNFSYFEKDSILQADAWANKILKNLSSNGKNARFLYFLETETLESFKESSPSLNENDWIFLLPLKERLGDLGWYVYNFFRENKAITQVPFFSSEAQACIFTYDWPGNYEELMSFLNKLKELKLLNATVDGPIVAKLLNIPLPTLNTNGKQNSHSFSLFNFLLKKKDKLPEESLQSEDFSFKEMVLRLCEHLSLSAKNHRREKQSPLPKLASSKSK